MDAGGRVGLFPGERYRCAGCGNLTRFDVEVTEHARRFWHAELSGNGRIEEDVRETTVHRVACRWCGSGDVVREPAPNASDDPAS